jgi:hypothetical protein
MKTTVIAAASFLLALSLPASAGCEGITCVFSMPKEMVGTWCPTKAGNFTRGGRCTDTAIIITNRTLEHGSGEAICTLGRAAYQGKYRSGTVVAAKFGCAIVDTDEPMHRVASLQVKTGRLHLHFEDHR